jgi:hypothetical protein
MGRTLFSLVVVGLMVSSHAHGMSWSSLSLHEITEQTDLWVRAHVLEVHKPTTFTTNDYGDTYYDLTVKLRPFDSTSEDIPDEIVLKSKTSFWRYIKQGERVFAALKRTGDGFDSLYQLGVYGWYSELADGRATTRQKTVDAEFLWNELKAIRIAVDNNGALPESETLELIASIKLGNVQEALMSLELLEQLERPLLAPVTLAENVLRIYDTEVSFIDRADPVGRDARWAFSNLFHKATDFIFHAADGEAAGLLADAFVEDAEMRRLFEDTNLEARVPVRLLLTPPSEENADRFVSLMGYFIRPDYRTLEALGDLPYPAVNDLLWKIVRDPARYDVKDNHALAGAWWALVGHRDPNIGNHLIENVLKSPKPNLETVRMNRTADAKNSAREVVDALPSELVDRRSYLEVALDATVEGGNNNFRRLGKVLTPDDVDAIDRLAELTLDANDLPEHMRENPNRELYALRRNFVRHVVLKVPDPAFVPQLTEWAAESPNADLLTALERCGEKELAIDFAESWLKAKHRAPDFEAFKDEVWQRLNVLIFLTKFNDSRAVDSTKPYYDLKKIEKFEQIYLDMASRENLEPNDYRLAAPNWREHMLPYLTKQGGGEMKPILTQLFKSGSITTKIISAMCLYHVGDELGSEIIDAYRNRTIRELAVSEEQWITQFHAGEIFHRTVLAMESPKLDQVFLERTKKGFGNRDDYVAGDKEYVDRVGPEVMKNVLRHLEKPYDIDVESAIYAFRKLLRQDFDYRQGASLAERKGAIEQCKKEARAYILSL